MVTNTESRTAIAMVRECGSGILRRTPSIERTLTARVINLAIIDPEENLADLDQVRGDSRVSGLLVVEPTVSYGNLHQP